MKYRKAYTLNQTFFSPRISLLLKTHMFEVETIIVWGNSTPFPENV